MEENKICPFNNNKCTPECALYVSPEELNETVRNKLASVGIVDRKKGSCALKNMAMCMKRQVFDSSR